MHKSFTLIVIVAIFCRFFVLAQSQALDQIGVTAFRAVTTNLNGSGIRVAQIEAVAPAFEVNPAVVGQQTNLFTYISAAGVATNFPNSVGSESGHANDVAQHFYGLTGLGVATNVAHVENIDAQYFYDAYIVNNLMTLGTTLVNQSFVFGNVTNSAQTNGENAMPVSSQQQLDSLYDNYAVNNRVLFVSPANNQYSVSPPGTAYNSICVGAYGANAASSVGPTLDNGRCKPDITAPDSGTSYSTPQVAGAAAILLQAAMRGDGGSDTNSLTKMQTIKALLLNGAVKPANWTNSTSSPLDARYGAGLLNLLNSYQQLAGGKQGSIISNLVTVGSAHPPTGATGTIAMSSGWDFSTNTSSSAPGRDAIYHYYFNVSNANAAVKFTATATLVWNRHYNATYLISPIGINDLNLFLYNCANSNLVLCSTSLVDNVEHLYVTNLAQGRYDLQVWKAGGSSIVSAAEPYALAWQFVPQPSLALAKAGTNLNLTWPVYPAGFGVEARTNLLVGTWATNGIGAPSLTNGLNSIRLNTTNAAQFFRLRSPNF